MKNRTTHIYAYVVHYNSKHYSASCYLVVSHLLTTQKLATRICYITNHLFSATTGYRFVQSTFQVVGGLLAMRSWTDIISVDNQR